MKIIGLDVGEKRIGIAKADSGTRIAVPVGFVEVDGLEWQEIAQVAKMNGTNLFVVGLPRSNEGNETAQSLYARNFAKKLVEMVPGARIRMQDESFTSVEAEERLKARKKKYQKGDIDAEAAAIILQDFLENLPTSSSAQSSNTPDDSNNQATNAGRNLLDSLDEARENVASLTKKETDKVKLNGKKAKSKFKSIMGFVVLPLLLLLVIVGVGGFLWARSTLSPVDGKCGSDCEIIEFTVSDGESKSVIANNLGQAGLVQNSLVLKMYLQLFKPDVNLKSGIYHLNKGMSADEIIDRLAKGVEDKNTFTFTILPGETIYDVKAKLAKLNFSGAEIEEALNADYDFAFLKDRPSGATLEGYLFGETYEFYENTSAKDIIKRFLEGMGEVIKQNDLEAKYAARGLTLSEGITLASIVQKEAPSPEQPTVAQVFLSRLNTGIPLGSDVTVSYALDTVDPDRQTYSDNAAALTVNSCYNTRANEGLPCGPISNPGLSALLSVANPSDTSYFYFLTGDDGLMYYSYTESEHNQNIYSHCQKLCNVSL